MQARASSTSRTRSRPRPRTRPRTSCAATSRRRRRPSRRAPSATTTSAAGRDRTTSTARSATTGSRATRTRTRSSATWARSSTTCSARTMRSTRPTRPQQFIVPNQPFLGATINQTGVLKREVTLYAFNQSPARRPPASATTSRSAATATTGSTPARARTSRTATPATTASSSATTSRRRPPRRTRRRACSRTTGSTRAGAASATTTSGAATAPTTCDVRPREGGARCPGLFPTSDPETWFQIAGAGRRASRRRAAGAVAQRRQLRARQDNFDDKDYHYGGWDQDTLQANIGDNGPHIGDRLLDWGGSYNGYYLCPSTYGDWVSTRAIAPGLIAFLQQMSQGDGATDDRHEPHVRLPRDRDRLHERARTTRSRSTRTRPRTSPAGRVRHSVRNASPCWRPRSSWPPARAAR